MITMQRYNEGEPGVCFNGRLRGFSQDKKGYWRKRKELIDRK
ncbi:hypothetical protein HMPREF9446_01069 [Bacteroides fluxus YIT 12057]|uniref:Uncharacterized protein n=1 Tax=Bacteroides fluxus YIT 12057 TaxID=763034 RepID=F3PQS1_9BACE|nr:hypothetical protein HMPREF9446_01069 [Bacteroides fluxus YIT 12057]